MSGLTVRTADSNCWPIVNRLRDLDRGSPTAKRSWTFNFYFRSFFKILWTDSTDRLYAVHICEMWPTRLKTGRFFRIRGWQSACSVYNLALGLALTTNHANIYNWTVQCFFYISVILHLGVLVYFSVNWLISMLFCIWSWSFKLQYWVLSLYSLIQWYR